MKQQEHENMVLFFKDIREKHPADLGEYQHIFDFDEEFCNHKECLYIFDLTQGKITYHSGFETVLKMKFEDLKDGLPINHIHPNDKETVFRISKATVSYCMLGPEKCKDSLLQLSYRFINILGEEIRLLSQSKIFEKDKNGFPVSLLIKLTDISFLEPALYVTWHFNALDLDQSGFRDKIYEEYKDFFSHREIEIIKLIEKELSNNEIGDQLNISEHTVATHRKNIFRKANRHNTKDLILFCKRKGIL